MFPCPSKYGPILRTESSSRRPVDRHIDKRIDPRRPPRRGNWRGFVIQEYPVEKVSAITGVPAESITEAARLYAATKPAQILHLTGIEEQPNATQSLQARYILPGITGNIDVRDDPLSRPFRPWFTDSSAAGAWENLQTPFPRRPVRRPTGKSYPVLLQNICHNLPDRAGRVHSS